MKENKSVQRYDLFGMYDPDSEYDFWLETKMKKTDEGFLKGRAVVTNIGVFHYLQEDGTIVRELRPPEEVFNPDSIESLKLKPVTNNHPTTLVTDENIKELQIGNLGDAIRTDTYHLSAPIVIQDQDAIQDVEEGKRGLSLGYTTDLKWESGNYLGTPYDAIQTNIRYNHCALVDRGRAGDAARLRVDNADVPGSMVLDQLDNIKKEGDMPDFKKIKLDGFGDAEFQAEAEVVKAFETIKSGSAKMDEEKTKLQAKYDTLKAEFDTFKEESKKKMISDEEIQKRVDSGVESKLQMLAAAKLAGVEVKDQSDLDLKKEIIQVAFPKMDLEGKKEIYIQASFDAAIGHLEKSEEEDSQNRQDQNPQGKDDGTKKRKSDSATKLDEQREAYYKHLEEQREVKTKV